MSKKEYVKRHQRIAELLEALNTAPDEDIVWIVNQLQELGFEFHYEKN